MDKKLTGFMRALDEVFNVEITHEDDMWIAVSERIGLVTEAPTYEALVERVRAVAPELIRDNVHDFAASPERPARIRFQHTELAF